MTMGLKDTSPVIPQEELYVSLLEEIEDLEDCRDRLVFGLDDGRQSLILDYLQSVLRRAQVRTHLRVEIVNDFLVVLMLARNVQVSEA